MNPYFCFRQLVLGAGIVCCAGFGSHGYAESERVTPYLPDKVLGELFREVQIKKVLSDYKTFVDSTPKRPVNDIISDYQDQRKNEGFNLRDFVLANFTLPSPPPAVKVTHEKDLFTHLKNHWSNLVRNPQKTSENSSLISLPNPYVVPGGRFREMFYWDSYFTIVGLLGADEDSLALGMIDNFAFLIDEYGYVPNGNRSYFLSRSQPPLFAATLLSYAKKHGSKSIEKYLPQLEKEYQFWMDDLPGYEKGRHLVRLKNGDKLNRYFGVRGEARAEAFGKEMRWASVIDEDKRDGFFRNLRAVCESGWDFSSRWYADGKNKSSIHAMDIAPVDLNALLYMLEDTIAKLNGQIENRKKEKRFRRYAEKRAKLIHRYFYDAETGTYQDYDIKNQRKTGRLSLAMAYPLFVGAATPEAAKSVGETLRSKFLKPGGLVTTLENTGEQWDYPNGWAPLQYIGVEGLLAYDNKALAHEIAKRWLKLNEKVYHAEGKMMEKYNVVDPSIKAGGGEYPNQDGFGWTNGVGIAFYKMLGRAK